ncbi:MAG: homoserine kinase [Kofleriaceae bacterium]|nr:homoserine kinase [Kofleriaceae bacterium]
MGTFTVLGEAELTQLAESFGLGEVQKYVPIAAGTINTNFELVTDFGTYFVRVNEGKAEADVAWEARVVATLAAAGVVTPPPIFALDGRPYAPLAGHHGKWCSVFAWRSGHHLAADDVTPELASRFGECLAGLHVAALTLPKAWRRGSIYDHDHLVARFEKIARVSDPALAKATRIIDEELNLASDVASIRRRATQGIIHGDLFRDNVLWDGGQISAILDFEQASGGSLAYDIAVCINDWCWTGAPRIDLAHALLAGYQRVRPLSAGDREALPYEVRAAATRFTITRITDVYLARVANPEKDFRAFLARVEAWRGQSLGELTSTL